MCLLTKCSLRLNMLLNTHESRQAMCPHLLKDVTTKRTLVRTRKTLVTKTRKRTLVTTKKTLVLTETNAGLNTDAISKSLNTQQSGKAIRLLKDNEKNFSGDRNTRHSHHWILKCICPTTESQRERTSPAVDKKLFAMLLKVNSQCEQTQHRKGCQKSLLLGPFMCMCMYMFMCMCMCKCMRLKQTI